MSREPWEAFELPLGSLTGLRFIDSHVHLADYEDPSQELAFASTGGNLLVTAGVGFESSSRGQILSREHPSLVASFVGVHPSEAEKEGAPDWLPELLRDASGVGEVGLDPKYSEVSRRSAQVRLLDLQLGAAEKAGKPVQVHSRGAERECLDLLGSYSLKRVLLHWFQGEGESAEALGRGYYVSFGPALLVSKKLQRISLSYDPDLVLVESDGPVPFAALDGAGGSWLIPSVVHRLAELWGSSFEDTSGRVLATSLRFLGQKGRTPGQPGGVSKA